MIRRFLISIARRGQDEAGAASIEFVLLFPVFFTLFISAFEVAMMNVRAVMLERATDIVVRDIRLSSGNNIEYEDVVDDICAEALVIGECASVLKIEMIPVDQTAWATLDGDIDCVQRDEDIEPVISFQNGQENELMLMRVCAIMDPFFPTIGVGRSMPKDASGGYIVSTSSAFVNEPN
ncbi:MAG: TadE/TadG family type IV pilus assembly protein [Paracoccaceae bacterium]|nr:TadE/TadG family type IV pilus assembly protein [Paracoccaceae bacterium]